MTSETPDEMTSFPATAPESVTSLMTSSRMRRTRSSVCSSSPTTDLPPVAFLVQLFSSFYSFISPLLMNFCAIKESLSSYDKFVHFVSSYSPFDCSFLLLHAFLLHFCFSKREFIWFLSQFRKKFPTLIKVKFLPDLFTILNDITLFPDGAVLASASPFSALVFLGSPVSLSLFSLTYFAFTRALSTLHRLLGTRISQVVSGCLCRKEV